MAIVSSTTTPNPTADAFRQLRVQQAKQVAQDAEENARSLQIQARDAQATADRAQERARDLGIQSDQALSTADRARQGVAALQTAGQMQARLGSALEKAAQVAPTPQQPQPVANSLGQVTGQVVNVTA